MNSSLHNLQTRLHTLLKVNNIREGTKRAAVFEFAFLQGWCLAKGADRESAVAIAMFSGRSILTL